MKNSMADVLIIGAGPTGLTMANVLARNGVRVRIVDKKAGPVAETRAIVVHAKTLELLNRLGLAGQAANTGQHLRALQLLKEGKTADKVSFIEGDGLTPYPFALIYAQDQIEHLLIESLNQHGLQVEWNTELLSLEQTATNTSARIRHADGKEETVEAGWTIGADGAHSPVRHMLGLGFTGESYKQALFLADVDLEGGLDRGEAAINFAPLGFFGFFPMAGGGQRFRIVGALPPELRERDNLTIAETQQVLDTYKGPPLKITAARWITVYRTHHRISEHFRVGRIFLIGDAAHIHSPAGGQGMNTGIGDAFNLAWKLALVSKGQAHASLLDSYEAERMPFARAILNGSDKAFQIQTMAQPLVQKVKMVAIPTIFRIVSGVPALRRGTFWLISQLWTTYQDSPAVTQSTPSRKKTQAGDRAPYGMYESGPNADQSIFETISGLDHHLLLFTGSDPTTSVTNVPQLAAGLQEILNTYTVPVQLHVVSAGNHSLHKLYDANVPSLILVRPDGHIAYRGPASGMDSLRTYLDRIFERKNDQPQNSAADQAERVIP